MAVAFNCRSPHNEIMSLCLLLVITRRLQNHYRFSNLLDTFRKFFSDTFFKTDARRFNATASTHQLQLTVGNGNNFVLICSSGFCFSSFVVFLQVVRLWLCNCGSTVNLRVVQHCVLWYKRWWKSWFVVKKNNNQLTDARIVFVFLLSSLCFFFSW